VTLLVVKAYPDLSSDLVAVLNGLTCALAANNARIARQVSE
jgi:hypothetical protein